MSDSKVAGWWIPSVAKGSAHGIANEGMCCSIVKAFTDWQNPAAW
jgi:hypothetical protein